MSRVSPDSITPTRLTRLIATAIISLMSLLIAATCIVFASFGINNWSLLVVLLPGSTILLLSIYLWLGWRLHWFPFLLIFFLAFLALLFVETIVFGVSYEVFNRHYFDITGTPIDMFPETPLDPLE
jgi:hypothetical protein